MKASELRALPVNELEAKMTDLKEEYLRLRCGHVTAISGCYYDQKNTS